MAEPHLNKVDGPPDQLIEPQQQQSVTPSAPPAHTPHKYAKYKPKVAVALGVTLVICGSLAIGLWVYGRTIQDSRIRTVEYFGLITRYYNRHYENSAGIWSGIIIVICGVVAICSYKRSQCIIVASLVCDFVAAIFGLVFTVFSAYAIWLDGTQNYGYSYNEYHFYAKNRLDRASEVVGIVLCLDAAISMVTIGALIIMASLALCARSCNKSSSPSEAYTLSTGVTHPYPQQRGAYPQQAAITPQQPGVYQQQPGAYPHHPGGYASQTGIYGPQPGPYPQQSGPYQQPGPFPQQPGPYPPQPGPYPLQSGPYSQQPGSYPQQPGIYSEEPPPYQEQSDLPKQCDTQHDKDINSPNNTSNHAVPIPPSYENAVTMSEKL